MELVANKKMLEGALAKVQGFAEKRNISEITSHVLLMAEGGKLIVRATDYTDAIELSLDDVDVHVDGMATANARRIYDVVRALPDGPVVLSSEVMELRLTSGSTDFKLPGMDPASFPDMPGLLGADRLPFNGLELTDALGKASVTIDPRSYNPVVSACVQIGPDGTSVVGTDTRRLALASMKSATEKERELLISKKAATLICKYASSEEAEVYCDETNIIVKTPGQLLSSRLNGGEYIDFKRVIPDSASHLLRLNSSEVLSALRKVAVISSDVKISCLPDRIMFDAVDSDSGRLGAHVEIEAKTGVNESVVFASNVRYITDFIGSIREDTFELHLQSASLPFMMAANNFITVAMPVVLAA